jgi:hypothetical protein
VSGYKENYHIHPLNGKRGVYIGKIGVSESLNKVVVKVVDKAQPLWSNGYI